MQIIGIDCATSPGGTGLARGVLCGGHVTLTDARPGTTRIGNLTLLSEWLLEYPSETLLCLDAPLGWPQPMRDALQYHAAGQGMAEEANRLFRRETDRQVRLRLGKQSLDVGADRIARTAHAALALLSELRQLTGMDLLLAWSPQLDRQCRAIEIYPAATLKALGLRASGYKNAPLHQEREEIIRGLESHLAVPDHLRPAMLASADVLDAVICVLCGLDFLEERCPEPEDIEQAVYEGWMWVRAAN